MSHTFSQNHLHVVFSTKERKKLIAPSMQPKLWAYMAGIARNHEFLVLANALHCEPGKASPKANV